MKVLISDIQMDKQWTILCYKQNNWIRREQAFSGSIKINDIKNLFIFLSSFSCKKSSINILGRHEILQAVAKKEFVYKKFSAIR